MGSGMFSAQNRQFVDNLQSSKLVPISESVNLINGVKDAAGSTAVIGLTYSPIYDNDGLVGSFWGERQNLQWTTNWQSVVETNGSAEVAVYDKTNDLEKLFEGNAAGRYVAKVFDSTGKSLYGWIGGVAVSSNVYTFSVYSGVALGTQNWFQGGATTFDVALKGNIEIYRYASSVTFGSTDTFTEEMPYTEEENVSDTRKLLNLTDGQYLFDYKNGRVLVKKANADDTETITYKTKVPTPIAATTSTTPGITTKSTTVAGGAVAISATALVVKVVEIQAPYENTDTVFVGTSTLNSAAPTTGVALIPGASIRLENVDLAQIYMDVLVDNEDVVAFYQQ